jgi:hypothetical protein
MVEAGVEVVGTVVGTVARAARVLQYTRGAAYDRANKIGVETIKGTMQYV